jgi:Fe-S-cluster containining protein
MHTDTEVIDPTIRCSACEAVCCRLVVVLMPEDDVPARFREHDRAGLEVMAKSEDGWCAALDAKTMRCSIYAQRPTVCRDFNMGGRACKTERLDWYKHTSSASADTLIEQLRER